MSENTNPYAPPQAPISGSGEPPLATPWIRLAAGLIDGIVLWPVNYVLGMILLKTPSATEVLEAAAKGPDAVEALMPGKGMIIVGQILSVVIFIAANFILLKKGQTIGKLALKLQVQNRTDGSLLPVNDILLRRVLPVYGGAALLSAIHPILGLVILADFLCVFRPGRNALHDDLANTKVVQLAR